MQEARAMLEATKKKKGVLLKDGEKFDKKAIMQVGRGGGGGQESFKGGGGRMPCVQPLVPPGMQRTALCILHAGMSQLTAESAEGVQQVERVCVGPSTWVRAPPAAHHQQPWHEPVANCHTLSAASCRCHSPPPPLLRV